MPILDVVQTIVFEDEYTKKVTDFVSFYNLPSQILKQDVHNHTKMKVSYNEYFFILMSVFLQVAYLYYYGLSSNKLIEVMKYALKYAKSQDYDVFNCLGI